MEAGLRCCRSRADPTRASFDPQSAAWRDDWLRLRGSAKLVCSIALPGDIYARHGTAVETRLSVLDKSVYGAAQPVIVAARRLDEALQVVLDTCGGRARPPVQPQPATLRPARSTVTASTPSVPATAGVAANPTG